MSAFCTRTLLALLLTPALTTAQGDECSEALPVTVGTYGPFDTGNATTSFMWPCASGGNDVWFVALAINTGTATFDTCGSGFDTCIEVFDGAGGCGNLQNLACNDDACNLQSSVTVPVVPGQLLYVRVGGWNGGTGSFLLNVAGDLGPATGFGEAIRYGEGCYNDRASFYELIEDPALFDLSNTSFTMVPGSSGSYTVVSGIAPFVMPTGNAQLVTLGDDSSQTLPLTTPFPYRNTTASSLEVYSNGFVATGSGSATIGTIVTANFFNEPDTAWRNWHDYDPSAGGQVTFEEVGTTAYFTWTDVPDWNVPGSMSTFQLQFDSAAGTVTFAFEQMSLTGGGGGGNGHMIGYSPGGPSVQPEELDISAALPATFEVQGDDTLELTLAAADRPIIGSSFTLDTGNVPTGVALGAQVFGLNQIAAGQSLAALGMPGCNQYLSLDTSVVLVPAGGAASYTITAPTSTGFAGVSIFAQSAMLVPGVNALGALASNGLQLRFDIN